MPKHPGGRPPKYNADVEKRICDALKMSATFELAAAYAGVSYEAFNAWRKKYPQFMQATEKAVADAALTNLAIIQKAAPRNWQAAAWKLERRHPKDYGRQITQLEGPPDEAGNPTVPFTLTIQRPPDFDEGVDHDAATEAGENDPDAE